MAKRENFMRGEIQCRSVQFCNEADIAFQYRPRWSAKAPSLVGKTGAFAKRLLSDGYMRAS